MRRGSNLPRVGSFNRAVVLEAIRGSSRGLTRAQLGRRTRLAPQTVSNVVKELLDTQLIEEAGTLTRGGRGRPGTRLRLNPSARFAVGVHLDPAWLGIVAVDLSGAVIAEVYEPLPSPDQPAAVTRHLASRIEAAIGLTGLPRERLLGVGVAAPGPLDEEAGTVSPPLLPGWHRIPLRGALAELTGATVLLEKDIIAAATAHTWRDAASGTADYAFLYVGAGVALATVLGSEVVRGEGGNAGEAGHVPADPAGPRCQCGGACLGAAAGELVMVRLARSAGISLPGDRGQGPQMIDDAFQCLIGLAAQGDERAGEIFAQAGRSIARAIIPWSELLDIRTLLVGGPHWDQMRALVEPAAQELLTRHAVHATPAPIRMLASPLGRQVGPVGAACLVLDEAYAPRADSLLI